MAGKDYSGTLEEARREAGRGPRAIERVDCIERVVSSQHEPLGSTVSVCAGSPIRSLGDRLLERLTQIGADPQDDDDTRASKALLVLISVLILPVSLLWAALYLAFGSPVGWVPLVYFAILLAAIVVFSRTRNFAGSCSSARSPSCWLRRCR